MSTPSTPRRSSRQSAKKRIIVKDTETSCYPDNAPATNFEQMVATLDSEAYPSARYAAVDDVVVYAFFKKKKDSNYHNQLQLKRLGSGAFPTQEEGLAISKMCNSQISHNNPGLDECQQVAEEIYRLYPNLFEADDVGILRQ
jgi:hypothetical protein